MRHRNSGKVTESSRVTAQNHPEMIIQEQENMIVRQLLFNSTYCRKVTTINRKVSNNDTDIPVTGFGTFRNIHRLKFTVRGHFKRIKEGVNLLLGTVKGGDA